MSAEYIQLVHQKAILGDMVRYLRTTYVGEEPADRGKLLVEERVFEEDKQVTEGAVQRMIDRLLQEQAEVDALLKKYTFGRHDEQEAAAQVRKPKSQKQRTGKAAPGKRRSAGSSPPRARRRS